MPVTVSVLGSLSNIDAYIAAVKEKLNAAAQDTAKAIAVTAKANAWKDTGELDNSITVEFDEANQTATVIVGAPYGMIQEFGRTPGSTAPPVEAIREWVARHMGQFGIGGKGADSQKQIDSIAFLVGRKIAQKGIAAKPFLHPAAEAERAPWEARVQEAINGAGRETAVTTS